jgi:uncharacterized protein YndB with AHSA1/START domain
LRVSTAEDAIAILAELGSPPEDVWRALTEAERIAEWWGDYVEFDARPEGRLVERWSDTSGEEVVTTGDVVELTAPSRIELSWADSGWEVETTVLIELEPVAAGTRLRLTHSGWEAFEPARRRRLIEAHAAGWKRHVENLAKHVSG